MGYFSAYAVTMDWSSPKFLVRAKLLSLWNGSIVLTHSMSPYPLFGTLRRENVLPVPLGPMMRTGTAIYSTVPSRNFVAAC